MSGRKQKIAQRLVDIPPTVFSEFSALAVQYQAVNLGQGFPDFDGPDAIKDVAIRAIREGVNQYAIGAGAQELRAAISEHSYRFYRMKVDPGSMITVTSGATEALLDSILGLVNPGEEVILFEPYYDSYVANVAMAHGVVRYVPLRPPDASHAFWWFDVDELAAAFNQRTALIVVNTPHNPTGKVFQRNELELIADLCLRHDAVALCDEVYEHIVFDPARHLRLATLPGMEERTVTVSSAGKAFSFTGWKVGWAIACPELRAAVQSAHQFVTFATAAPLQTAVAAALRLPQSYFDELAASYRQKRDHLAAALENVGLKVTWPEGSYFVMADISGLGFSDDFEFCRFLTAEVGVTAIPPSAFYSDSHRDQGRSFARFAFCKSAPVLAEAVKRLARLPSARNLAASAVHR